MRIYLLLLTLALLLADSRAGAQVRMEMKASLDKTTEQLMNDLINRRVTILPAAVSLKKDAKLLSFEFHNPTDDTLEMEIKISNVVPPVTKQIFPKGEGPKKSLLSNEDESEVTSIYKPMAEWISDYPKKIVLAPKEKKTVDVKISVPEELREGEYAAWIVAEVAPRKSLLEANRENNKSKDSKENNEESKTVGHVKGLSITVSSGKMTYKESAK